MSGKLGISQYFCGKLFIRKSMQSDLDMLYVRKWGQSCEAFSQAALHAHK
jgi:hypothetical protein